MRSEHPFLGGRCEFESATGKGTMVTPIYLLSPENNLEKSREHEVLVSLTHPLTETRYKQVINFIDIPKNVRDNPNVFITFQNILICECRSDGHLNPAICSDLTFQDSFRSSIKIQPSENRWLFLLVEIMRMILAQGTYAHKRRMPVGPGLECKNLPTD